MGKKVAIIGAGFSGLSAACALAKEGFEVTVFEKNESAGGRASAFSENGFMFDMGPSWYWMPDVFEWFFDLYGKQVSDYYSLKRLDPGYRIFFDKDDITDIPASKEKLYELFEELEPGSSSRLEKFLEDAAYKYQVGMKDLIFQPCNSILEFADRRIFKSLFKIQLFTSLRKEVYAKFKNEKIRKILEFPVYFLGALPSNTPALYSILNYADLVLGTWYPHGGMYKIIEAMVAVAKENNVQFHFNAEVERIQVKDNYAQTIYVNGEEHYFDAVIASADYHHVEKELLDTEYRNYSEAYWNKKVFAPSCIIFYLGVKGRINKLLHHNLFFDSNFETFAEEIYISPKFPDDPLFYVCCPSKTDNTITPEDCENLFVLIPVTAGLNDTNEINEKYYEYILNKLENLVGENIKQRILYKKTFSLSDFKNRYHAYKGNAYGLANTLFQTAVFKPKLHNKKVKNLFYAGQLTVPGPGIPPSIISGYLAAKELIKAIKK